MTRDKYRFAAMKREWTTKYRESLHETQPHWQLIFSILPAAVLNTMFLFISFLASSLRDKHKLQQYSCLYLFLILCLWALYTSLRQCWRTNATTIDGKPNSSDYWKQIATSGRTLRSLGQKWPPPDVIRDLDYKLRPEGLARSHCITMFLHRERCTNTPLFQNTFAKLTLYGGHYPPYIHFDVHCLIRLWLRHCPLWLRHSSLNR